MRRVITVPRDTPSSQADRRGSSYCKHPGPSAPHKAHPSLESGQQQQYFVQKVGKLARGMRVQRNVQGVSTPTSVKRDNGNVLLETVGTMNIPACATLFSSLVHCFDPWAGLVVRRKKQYEWWQTRWQTRRACHTFVALSALRHPCFLWPHCRKKELLTRCNSGLCAAYGYACVCMHRNRFNVGLAPNEFARCVTRTALCMNPVILPQDAAIVIRWMPECLAPSSSTPSNERDPAANAQAGKKCESRSMYGTGSILMR